jgi:hypothetical protein
MILTKMCREGRRSMTRRRENCVMISLEDCIGLCDLSEDAEYETVRFIRPIPRTRGTSWPPEPGKGSDL